MSIMPVSRFSTIVVTVCNVYSAKKADFSVNDKYLPVVAIVKTAHWHKKAHRRENQNLYSVLSQMLKKFFLKRDAAHAVNKKAHLNTAPCLFNEQVCKPISRHIIFQYICLNMNMICRLPDSLIHSVQSISAVKIKINIAVIIY